MDTKEMVIGGAIIGVVVLAILWQVRKDAITIGGAVVTGAKATATALNPTNHDNIIYGGVNSVGQALNMDPGWTFGGWIYDITHTTSPAP